MRLSPRRLSQLGRVVTGKTPATSRQEYFGGDYLFVTPSDLDYNHYYCRVTERTVTTEARAALPRQFVPAEAVMFTCIGATIGKCGIAPAECLTNQQINSVVANEQTDSKFLYYLLCRNVDVVKGMGGGSATPIVSKSKFEEIEFLVPSLRDQQAIAGFLSAYDDLIENNRRRMALLENAARLLYQEWFVRLRFPGHEHNRLSNGLPKGWENIKLESIINVTHGYAFAGDYFSEEPSSRVLTTPGNFRIGGGVKLDKLKFYSDEGPLDSSYVLNPMDLILTMTDLSQMSDTLGCPAFVPGLDGLSFLHNQRLGRVISRGKFFPKHFLYCLFCDGRYRHHVVGSATGTSVKHTSPKRILSYVATLPTKTGLLAAFENTLEPLFQQINYLIRTNQKLRAARDLLLPRLMSGELVV
jgi:type I restriction enzyme, S subunit